MHPLPIYSDPPLGFPQPGSHRLTWTYPVPGCMLRCGWLPLQGTRLTKMLHKQDLPALQDQRKQQHFSFFCKVGWGACNGTSHGTWAVLKIPSSNQRQKRPAKFQDFTAKNIIVRQATLNSRPFLAPHSNTKRHKNSFFPHIWPLLALDLHWWDGWNNNSGIKDNGITTME